MKLIILFLTLLAKKALSEKSNNNEVGRTLASIWNKTSSTSITFSRFGSIISDRHILVESGSMKLIETIGVAYGLYDPTKVNIGNIDNPKKIINHPDESTVLSLLEMDKIGCNTRLVCLPSFFDFNDKKPIIGSFIESGEIKTFDVSLIEKSRCEAKLNDVVHDGKETSSATPLQWFNPKNKIWYLVGAQWNADYSTVEIAAYNISYFKPWIQKTVEDGSLNALLSPC